MQINCVQLYRVTSRQEHLDTGEAPSTSELGTSVNRSRHNQSYKPLVEQAKRSVCRELCLPDGVFVTGRLGPIKTT